MSLSAAQGAERLRPSASHDPEIPLSDDELLRRVATGDHEAFAALYDHLGGVAYALARSVAADSALADEVTQEAFLDVWLKAVTFDPSRGAARAWVLMITRRRAVDAVRREQSNRDRLRRSALLTADRPYDMVVDRVLQRAAAKSADAEVTRALAALTSLQREAIELAYFGGFTYPEVAVLLDIPLPTAKSRIRDGLIRLAAEIRSGSDMHQRPVTHRRLMLRHPV